MNSSSEPLLSVEDLVVSLPTDAGLIRPVDVVSFDVYRGSSVGIVGESGCGKTMTALSIMRLLPPPGVATSGHIRFDGMDLLSVSEREMTRYRGKRIAMVFQEPMTSLNPVYSIGFQMVEAIRAHERMSHRKALDKAVEMLRLMGLGAASSLVDAYPHQLSGGMRQRVLIGMALSCNPDLLIADEPTTALDVTIQAQIFDTLAHLRERLNTAMMLITHDLAVLASFAEIVVVMYAAQVVEIASVRDLFASPAHPYTCALLESLPPSPVRYDVVAQTARPRELRVIPGQVPSLAAIPKGCRFHNRCPHATDRCRSEEPPLTVLHDGRSARCFYPRGSA